MHQLVMMSKASYSLEELDIAVQRIKEEGLSYHKAAAQNGIHDHVTGKAMSSKRGPPTVLMAAEKQIYASGLGFAHGRYRLWSHSRTIVCHS